MEQLYTFVIVILAILAVSGLFVGVTNDAVNFLNSAIGSKAASRKVILAVASVGIVLGTISSSGMMEVARSGMFNPSLFSFHEVIMLYLAVMFANVILLDLYNTWGLPTSTTVALIFCLLGAAIAVSTHKISSSETLTMSDLGHFINSTRALGIVSAILLSVVIAFTVGTFVMYLSRLIFTFNYPSILRKFGPLWCGSSLTAIVYFAIFKGMKSAIAGLWFISYIDQHIWIALLICWVVCSGMLYFVQIFKVNILRFTILSGTFALALAFAGNDLVNFIGVPVAGYDAYKIAQEAGSSSIMMDALNDNVPANFIFLLIAGGIMILTLWTSNKAMRVTETEISLSAQGEGEEQYGSSAFSRTVVRAAVSTNTFLMKVVPKRLREAISNRFEFTDVEHSGAPYDMIRATVNLTTSAMLISVATSLKLPLSTTYVCFMVAMGSSLADRAWGRESAVYRITGVMTVVAGWFVTALGGFLIAYAVGLALIYGGTVAIIIISCLATYMLVHSNLPKKKSDSEQEKPKVANDILSQISAELVSTVNNITRIYDRTLLAVFKENRKALRDGLKEAEELYAASREKKYTLMSTIRKIEQSSIDKAQFYVQAVDYLNEMTKALIHIVRPAYEHINNNHEGLNKAQTEDLRHIGDQVESINRHIIIMLRENEYSDTDNVLAMRDHLFGEIEVAIKNELARINANESNTKASMLYLTILNETKTMVLQSRNLLKSQRSYAKERGIPNIRFQKSAPDQE